jgi:hypothetical protein
MKYETTGFRKKYDYVETVHAHEHVTSYIAKFGIMISAKNRIAVDL